MSGFRADDLAVVIPTRDRLPILQRTLDALARQTVSGFDVIVVHDGLDQPTVGAPGVETMVKAHGGPGAARNAGVGRTSRPLVLFLGDDMVPHAGLVDRHLARHTRSPESSTAVLGLVEWHGDVARNRILRWFDWSSSQFDYRNITGAEAGWGRFYSSNVSLKRSFFLDAGGFDEEFVYYYEDLDCAWRLHERGLKLLYEPAARAFHLHAYSMEQVLARFEGIARGERRMAAKHPWFSPFFASRVRSAESGPPISRLWPRLVDAVPRRAVRLRGRMERRANDWYYQQIGPRFWRGWEERGV